jgi:WD40 repeat protein
MAFIKNLFRTGKPGLRDSTPSAAQKLPFKQPKKYKKLAQLDVAIHAMCYLPRTDGILIAYQGAGDNVGLKLLSARSGKVIWSRKLDWVNTNPRDRGRTVPRAMSLLRLSPDGDWFCGAGWDFAEIRSTATGELIKDLHDPGWESCSELGMSSDGQFIAIGVRLIKSVPFGEVLIFTPKGECLPGKINIPLFINSIDFCPNTHNLAIGDSHGQIVIADAETGIQRQCWEVKVKKHEVYKGGVIGGPSNSVGCLAYSRTGRLLAVALNNGQVELWEPGTGDLLLTLPGHAGTIYPNIESLFWCGNDYYLLTSGEDGALRLWDVETGAMVWMVASQPLYRYYHPALLTNTGLLIEAGVVAGWGRDGSIRCWKTGFDNG